MQKTTKTSAKPAKLAPPPGVGTAEPDHEDIAGDPESMTLEAGYWYRGKLGEVFQGSYGPARKLYQASYGNATSTGAISTDCVFWVPTHAALKNNVLVWPKGTEVAMQVQGKRPIPGMNDYTEWKVWKLAEPKTAAKSPNGGNDLPF